jgi:hypothetical protein
VRSRRETSQLTFCLIPRGAAVTGGGDTRLAKSQGSQRPSTEKSRGRCRSRKVQYKIVAATPRRPSVHAVLPFRLDSSSGQANWATCFALCQLACDTMRLPPVLNKAISQQLNLPRQSCSSSVFCRQDGAVDFVRKASLLRLAALRERMLASSERLTCAISIGSRNLCEVPHIKRTTYRREELSPPSPHAR